MEAIADPDWEQLEAKTRAEQAERSEKQTEVSAEIESGAELESGTGTENAAEINTEPACGAKAPKSEETSRD